ncbi:MAG: hypothetical protein C5S48_03790 [Candidatus Methanogaster sp.]|nr:MAG: hypothetical protein C5S48_03790 [ANME-2 cluster archaeon]
MMLRMVTIANQEVIIFVELLTQPPFVRISDLFTCTISRFWSIKARYAQSAGTHISISYCQSINPCVKPVGERSLFVSFLATCTTISPQLKLLQPYTKLPKPECQLPLITWQLAHSPTRTTLSSTCIIVHLQNPLPIIKDSIYFYFFELPSDLERIQ